MGCVYFKAISTHVDYTCTPLCTRVRFPPSPHQQNTPQGVFLLDKKQKSSFIKLPYLGDITDLEQICKDNEVEDVIIAVEKEEHLYINKIILSLSMFSCRQACNCAVRLCRSRE